MYSERISIREDTKNILFNGLKQCAQSGEHVVIVVEFDCGFVVVVVVPTIYNKNA